ncbi:MAG: ABC transporter permease [Chloroflexi bacterium]|nr:ABC transporter permease [Chloroflexota bacterium]MDA1145293.1 ABC transporter permease [Chloroflexota bacterium]
MSGLGGAWLVAQREIRERTGARTFRISTLLILVIAFGAVAAATILPDIVGQGTPVVAVVTSDVNDTFGELLDDGSLGTEVHVVLVADRDEARRMVANGGAVAAFYAGPSLIFDREADRNISALVTQAYRLATLPDVLASLDLTLEEAAPLVNPEPIPITLLNPETADGERASEADRGASSAAVVVLLLSLTAYGSWILNGVVEEKTSRVVEVLMGALRPWQLLLGKVGGILLLAVSQIAIGIAAALIAISIFGTADLPAIGFRVGAFAAAYLVLGLLFYSFIFAAAGATVARQEDAQAATMPINITLIVIYFTSLTLVVSNPDSLTARVLSILPVSSPLAMTPRIGVGSPPLWEIALSLTLLILSIGAIVNLSGRIYAGAILSTGPRIGLREAWRSARETR